MEMGSNSHLEWERGPFDKVLAALQEKSCQYFVKELKGAYKQDHPRRRQMVIPQQFVRENCDKFMDNSYLATRNSQKRWWVQFSFHFTKMDAPHVPFSTGWREFVADNDLIEGDRLIFVLTQHVVVPYFKVYIFRGRSQIIPELMNGDEIADPNVSQWLTT